MDTKALVDGLRSGVVSMAGLDVYEKESSYFFRDCSDTPVQVCDGGTAHSPEAEGRALYGRTLFARGDMRCITWLSFFISMFSVFQFLSFSFGPVGPSIASFHHLVSVSEN